jgi:hypothetical protein
MSDTQNTINWQEPIETVDGDAVKLRWPQQALGVSGTIEVMIAGDDVSRTYNRDGKHYNQEMPDIRNTKPEQAKDKSVSPADDIAARMEKALRKLAAEDIRSHQSDGVQAAIFEARNIVAELPEVVDGDLLEAREIACEQLMSFGASSEMIAADDISKGERDDAIVVHVALAAIRRGRALERGE